MPNIGLQNDAKKYRDQRQPLLFRYDQMCMNCTNLGVQI